MGRDNFETRFFQAEYTVKCVLSPYLLSVKIRNQVEMKHFNAQIIIKKAFCKLRSDSSLEQNRPC